MCAGFRAHLSLRCVSLTTSTLHVHATHVLGGIRQQGHLPGLFESHAEKALMLGARPGLPTGFDFSSIGDVAFHKTAGIFVIDLAYMIVTELTYFAARCTLTAPALTPFAAWGPFRSSLHGLFFLLTIELEGVILQLA
jgi:hypothetical protein